MYLAIDTSTDTASLALVQDNEVLAELTWRCGQNHSTQLLPNLSHLLSQMSLELKAISSIIVAQGPGSYNGLRVGISTAKGLAFSLGIPVVGISSLEAEAYQHAETGLPVCPIFNAGRGEIATAIYQKKHNKWRQFVGEHITTVDTLCSQITIKTIFCGEFIPLIATQLRKQLKQKAVIPSPATGLRRASFLAELGLKRLKAGDYDNPATLQPLYLRQPAITKPKHQQNGGRMVSQPQMSIDTDKSEASSKKAVIWDMDGIIVDSARHHLKGWQIVFQKRGVNYTEKDFWHNTGKRSDTIIKNVLGKKIPKNEITKIIQEKDETFRQLMGQNIRPFPGVLKLIASLKEHGFKIAIASSAPMENIQLITRSLKIHNHFDTIVSGWEVTRGKPDPQTFLLAAKRLGVEAERCIIIEDAISGVTASRRAGMPCIAVTNTTPREELREADLIIDTLEEITTDDLDRLLHQHK